MKKTLFTLFTVVITSVCTTAQNSTPHDEMDKKSPEERAENITKKMTKELVLTTEQQSKVKALLLKREQERQERMKEEKIRREKMDADLKAILTPDQYNKLETMKKEKKQQHHGKGNPQNAPQK